MKTLLKKENIYNYKTSSQLLIPKPQQNLNPKEITHKIYLYNVLSFQNKYPLKSDLFINFNVADLTFREKTDLNN